MYENIALIKEFHNHMSTFLAQKEAGEYLKKIGLDNIGLNRASECSNLEIFYVMFIRALMSKEPKIIIASPFSITDDSKEMKSIIENMQSLGGEKNILILDLNSNQTYYEESLCNIIK